MDKKIVKVKLDKRSYDIIIGDKMLADFPACLHKTGSYSKIFIITDENIAGLHLAKFSAQLKKSSIAHQVIILKAGEKTKDFASLENLCEKILASGIDRKSLLIAFGGGVIGDLGGFVASILLRGIDFIQVPTTLLAMVDSSVGGKTAINSKFGKNLIGSFYQPKLVFCDLDFLETLPKREFLSGYAEVVKYGLIRDKSFFEYLEKNYQKINKRDKEILKKLVVKSCQIKAEIVSIDEKENGIRALLNFGHTFGHIFETETNYSDELFHGEAVAIGMVLAVQLSILMEILDVGVLRKVKNHLEKVGLPVSASAIRKKWNIDNLIEHLHKDKKSEHQKLTFILLEKIGGALVKKDVEKRLFFSVMQEGVNQNTK